MDFKTILKLEEKDEFLKTRIESIHFSSGINKKLKEDNIITIRGLINKDNSDLKKIGLNKEDINLIIEKLTSFEIKLKMEIEERILKKQENLDSSKNFNILESKMSEINNKLNDKEETILDYFAKRLGFNLDEIRGPSRRGDIVKSRDIVIYILRQYGNLSFPQIARILGDRDHSTIMYSFNKISKLNIDNNIEDLILKAKELKDLNINRARVGDSDYINEAQKLGIDIDFSYIKPKILNDRNLDILNSFRDGLTFDNIGVNYNITRERARQIVKDTLYKIAYNESIKSKEKIPDIDDLYKKERDIVLFKKRESRPVKIIKEKFWSRDHKECVSCKTINFKHIRYGLCEKCAGHFSGDNRENIILEHNHKCDSCGISRDESKKLYGRDFYITKDMKVFCKGCHLVETGKKLSTHRINKWRMFYK